ncbi:hypothetical protein DPMN_104639 [Dreissena polymorpha]|uniref:Apple domain-containing protein n=1 Tax=Dreissena polymorpha TaxID=45954 RepID=A0A9D4HDI1_DREPO|nr:hypothetical protein DPMN_104639 [Dreissena polymorpha]
MSDNRSPDLSFENEADGLLVESSASLLDVSLRLHDYGRFTPVPAIIRHQCEQVQPELISVVTQTDDTRVPRSISTQTSTETSTVGIQVDRPSFTFEDIRDDDDKVLFYTGIPTAGTFECLFDEIFLIRSVKIYNRNVGRDILRDVELYVGLSEAGFQSREGFHPGDIGVLYTFELATPVYEQWVRITRSTPNDVLTLCEDEKECVPYSAANGTRYSVCQGYVHIGTAIDVSAKVLSNLLCASSCSKTENCISAHYNKDTLICSLFDSLKNDLKFSHRRRNGQTRSAAGACASRPRRESPAEDLLTFAVDSANPAESVTLEPDVLHTVGIAVFSKMQRACHPLFIVGSSLTRTCQRSRL